MIENYTQYTEVDANGDITITPSRIDIDTLSKTAVSYVYIDKGSGFFRDFEHWVTINASDSGTGNGIEYWSVSNVLGNRQSKVDGLSGLSLYNIQTSGAASSIVLYDNSSGNLDSFSTSTLFTYYIKIYRIGSLLTADIYSDSTRKTLADRISINCNSETYRYLYALAALGGSSSPSSKSGYVEKLNIFSYVIAPKKEFSAIDAAPAVLYAKKDLGSVFAEPILATDNNILMVSTGLVQPGYDYIDLSPPNQPTTITYKVGGSSGVTLSVLNLTYSGSDVATVTRV